MTTLETLRADARNIFTSALAACDIPTAFDRGLRFSPESLTLSDPAAPLSFRDYTQIFVVAFGKAAVPMTRALLERLPARIPVSGLCAAPQIPADDMGTIRCYAAEHPLPNAESFRAARAALELLARADARTLVFFLISGGGSALLELPLDPSISLDDTRAFHQALIACGASITQINAIRARFSTVKGGRLAAAAPEAMKVALVLSDVPSGKVESVASSPTLADNSAPHDCLAVLNEFGLLAKFPASVRQYFLSQNLIAPPPTEPSRSARNHFQVLLSEKNLIEAACTRACQLGYEVVMDNICDGWDATDAAVYLLRRFRELSAKAPRLCLLSGGETTIKLGKNPGIGGRNQHFALAAAVALAENPTQSIAALSAGSDGIDGNSAAAGAIADPTTLTRARSRGLDPDAALARFDSGTLFAALGDAIVTGPTGNNLRDLRILLDA